MLQLKWKNLFKSTVSHLLADFKTKTSNTLQTTKVTACWMQENQDHLIHETAYFHISLHLLVSDMTVAVLYIHMNMLSHLKPLITLKTD